jgi:TRAP-type uncharacterized transport system substrate-binding protein
VEREQYERLAFGAAIVGIVVALVTGRLPRWLRIVLVLALVAICIGAGLYAYHHINAPKTLRIAASSIDGEATRVTAALAARMAAAGAPVRLKLVTTPTPNDALGELAAGRADLAIGRADAGDLSSARAVVTLTHAVVLMLVPPGSPIETMAGLKGKTIGVIGEEVNGRITFLLSREYDLGSQTRFTELTLDGAAQALREKRVQALMVVTPLAPKYIAMVREFFAGTGVRRFALIPIESAGAIAALDGAYESFDLPQGTLRGSPAVPADELTTLRVPILLLADKKLDNATVGALARSIMETRRSLLAEYPVLAQISAPDTDKDAFIPVHPGAAAYFDGEEQGFFEKYGDAFFYASVLLGFLVSAMAAIWKYMTKQADEGPSMAQIETLMTEIAAARSTADLELLEDKIDRLVVDELRRASDAGTGDGRVEIIDAAVHRLEYLMQRRYVQLVGEGVAGRRLRPLATPPSQAS